MYLFENLQMFPHAPDAQMQAVPEDAFYKDSGNEEGENEDERIPIRE